MIYVSLLIIESFVNIKIADKCHVAMQLSVLVLLQFLTTLQLPSGASSATSLRSNRGPLR